MAAKRTKAPARNTVKMLLAALPFVFPATTYCAHAAPAKKSRAGVSQRTIVIGFLGGYVSRDSAIRSEVKMAKRLKADYLGTVLVETFENRHLDDAYKEILKFISGSDALQLSDEQKRRARVVIYGHSWGGCATVELARRLEKQGIPVLLTLQVDSVSHWWANDSLIPANVEKAINFYQSAGLLHGQKEIHAADASRTQILGNKGYDYRKHPVKCQGYPFWDRWFAKTHMQIECDPSVWGQVESLIRAELGPPAAHWASN
jgi:hypothetical protein